MMNADTGDTRALATNDVHILVLEDDPQLSDLIQRILEGEGYKLDTASSGQKAHKVVKKSPPDLLLLDYRLPDTTAKQFVLELRDQDVRIPYIVMTGLGDDQVAAEVMKLGASDYLSKGTDFIRKLPGVIKHAIERNDVAKRLEDVERNLRKNEKHYRQLFEQNLAGVYHFTDDGTIVDCNVAFVKMLGYDRREEVLGKKVGELFASTDDFERFRENLQKGGRWDNEECRLLHRDGKENWILQSAVRMDDGENGTATFQSTAIDINERKQAESELKRINRELKTISECNLILVRSTRLNELLTNICNAVVETGGYRSVWVGLIENGGASSLRIEASAGLDGNIATFTAMPLHDHNREQQGPVDKAIETGEPVVSRNLQELPECEAWRKVMHTGEFTAMIILPLISQHRTLGVLSICSVEQDAFIPEEIRLLKELAADLSYGITALQSEQRRRKVEEDLRESEKRFRLLAQNAEDVIFRITFDSLPRVEYVSPSVEKMTGYLPEAFEGNPQFIFSIIHPRDRKDVVKLFEDPLNAPPLQELRLQHKSGRWIWVEQRQKVVLDEQGKVDHLEGISRDVTQRKEAEEDLRESEHKFRSFIENSNDGIFVIADDRMVFVNPAFSRMLEYTEKEILNPDFHWTEMVASESRNFLVQLHQKRMKGEDQPTQYEFVGLTKKGKRITLEASVAIIDYERMDAVMGIIRDITGRKQAERNRVWLTQAFDASPGIVLLANPDGRIRWTNQLFRKLFEYSSSDLNGKPLLALFDLKGSEFKSPSSLPNVLHEKRGRWQGQLQGKSKSGKTIPIYLTVIHVRDKRNVPVGMIAEGLDQSAIMDLQSAKTRLENELSRQFHLSQVGLLASGISHNLRNPLSVIMLYNSLNITDVEKVLNETPDDPIELYDALEKTVQSQSKIQHAAERIDQIVEEIMDYHRMNAELGGEVSDLNKVLQADAAMLKSDLDIKHHIRVVMELGSGPIWVGLKASDIAQIFLNLAANARDAMLSVDLRTMTVRTGVEEDKKRAWFEVEDTGKGIPEKVLKRIGEAFLTTKDKDEEARKRGSGTGLGLYMIKRLLDQYKGDMKVASQPGKTVFRIFLPAVSQKVDKD